MPFNFLKPKSHQKTFFPAPTSGGSFSNSRGKSRLKKFHPSSSGEQILKRFSRCHFKELMRSCVREYFSTENRHFYNRGPHFCGRPWSGPSDGSPPSREILSNFHLSAIDLEQFRSRVRRGIASALTFEHWPFPKWRASEWHAIAVPSVPPPSR